MLDRVSAFNLTQNEICFQDQLNSLTPINDQDRISPHNINTISNRQVMRIKEIKENKGIVS